MLVIVHSRYYGNQYTTLSTYLLHEFIVNVKCRMDWSYRKNLYLLIVKFLQTIFSQSNMLNFGEYAGICHLPSTSLKELNFPWLRLKFPDKQYLIFWPLVVFWCRSDSFILCAIIEFVVHFFRRGLARRVSCFRRKLYCFPEGFKGRTIRKRMGGGGGGANKKKKKNPRKN